MNALILRFEQIINFVLSNSKVIERFVSDEINLIDNNPIFDFSIVIIPRTAKDTPKIMQGNIIKTELSIEIATIPIITNIPPIIEKIIPLFSFLFSVIFYSADLKLVLPMNGNVFVYDLLWLN